MNDIENVIFEVAEALRVPVLVLALLALATVGGVMARLNGRRPARGVVRQLAVGVAAAGATYLFGTLFGVTVG